MNKLKFLSLLLSVISIVSPVWAQTVNQTEVSVNNYNYNDAFSPLFYTKNGNDYRSAGGQPGPNYWQNRADYKLSVRLNDQTNEISGTEIITYTNNSPD
jgi:hypothetical protein